MATVVGAQRRTFFWQPRFSSSPSQVGEGWDSLCSFLGKPIPDTPWPHENRFDILPDKFKLIYSSSIPSTAALTGLGARKGTLQSSTQSLRFFVACRGNLEAVHCLIDYHMLNWYSGFPKRQLRGCPIFPHFDFLGDRDWCCYLVLDQILKWNFWVVNWWIGIPINPSSCYFINWNWNWKKT